jgi:cytochrome c556
MKTNVRIAAILSAATVTALGVIVWNADTSRAAAAGNMKDYMVNVVMPNTQPLWDNGYADKISNEDWTRMQQAATRLQATIPTITSGGSVPAEQTRAKSAVWQDWTKKMAAAVATTKTAVEKKDQMGLQTGGDSLVEICEGCHMAFDPTAAK